MTTTTTATNWNMYMMRVKIRVALGRRILTYSGSRRIEISIQRWARLKRLLKLTSRKSCLTKVGSTWSLLQKRILIWRSQSEWTRREHPGFLMWGVADRSPKFAGQSIKLISLSLSCVALRLRCIRKLAMLKAELSPSYSQSRSPCLSKSKDPRINYSK